MIPAKALSIDHHPAAPNVISDQRRLPRVSILVPVRNEESAIERVLASLCRQDYPRDLVEVLVIDGRSRDRTREIVIALASKDSRVRLLDNPGLVVPTAMNLGIDHAKGDVFVRADGHTEYAEDYVRASVAALNETDADVVGGPMVPKGDTPFGRAVAFALTSPLGVGGSSFHFADRRGEAESVYLGVFRKSVFARFGSFDEALVRNQDDEWFYRARSKGATLFLDPSIRSVYRPRSTRRSLFKQYFGYGLFKPIVLKNVPGGMRPRHLAPSLLVLSVAFLAILGFLEARAWLLLSAMIGAYVGGLGLGAFRGARREGVSVFASLQAFMLMHWGYGLGFLLGLPRRSTCADLKGLRETYGRYAQSDDHRRKWNDEAPGQDYLLKERDEHIASSLREHFGASLSDVRILDLGAGSTDLGERLSARGMPAPRIVSLDILQERLEERSAGSLVVGDARRLPFADQSFDVVIQCTMLSSLPALATRRVVCSEMHRLLREGGLLLSYDARLPNPFNSRVRRVSRSQLQLLFEGARCRFQTMTVIPALARRLPDWLPALSRLPFLHAFELSVMSWPRKGASS